MSAIFQIKNMVCDRCKMVVQQSFQHTGFQVLRTDLGEVEVVDGFAPNQLNQLSDLLKGYGFELLKDRNDILIEKIKNAVIDLIQSRVYVPKINYSAYLSEKLNQDYSGLSVLFSTHEGMTIEQYIIRQKIERVKELLRYDELSLSQIADELQYSSVAHLSGQFKKVTGITPSQFKQTTMLKRIPLDSISTKII
ncbi:MAG: helix-turn-helix transcriptional regulator [Spirosomataceae bacterium]